MKPQTYLTIYKAFLKRVDYLAHAKMSISARETAFDEIFDACKDLNRSEWIIDFRNYVESCCERKEPTFNDFTENIRNYHLEKYQS